MKFVSNSSYHSYGRLWSWKITPEAAYDMYEYILADFSCIQLDVLDTGENRPMIDGIVSYF